jgi:hypothetical protein
VSAVTSKIAALFAASVLALCLTGGCTPARPDVPSRGDSAGTAEAAAPFWRAARAGPALKAASCPQGQAMIGPETIQLDAAPVELIPDGGASLPEGVSFVAGWHLTSDNPRFGGLSGIEYLANGTILAVTDKGDLVSFPISKDGMPAARAKFSFLRDERGDPLDGKKRGDAEGLAITDDGLMLVSFERDHRVMGFDLLGCGAGMLGAEIVRWPPRLDGLYAPLDENRGAEALTLLVDGRLLIGLETLDKGSPIEILREGRAPRFTDRLAPPGTQNLTGLDAAAGHVFSLFRFWAPIIGNKIAVQASPVLADGTLGTPRLVLRIEPPMAVDNFEGIATQDLGDGRVRLYLISDDNFSTGQRTLLFVFDVRLAPPPSEAP